MLRDVGLGVATSSFQTEGGIDTPGGVITNWCEWAEIGRVEPIGPACDLWRRYDEAAARAQAMSLSLFRMSLEWARLAPHGTDIDPRVARDYASRMATLRAHGLEPIVTLTHFTYPEPLGRDFWLDSRAVGLFTAYSSGAVAAIGEALIAQGQPPLRRIVTLNEPNSFALGTYLAGMFPHGEPAAVEGAPLGIARMIRSLDLQLAAHIEAYHAVHALYASRGWARPDITTNANVLDVYGMGGLHVDLLRLREYGVKPSAFRDFVRARADRFHATLFAGEHTSDRAALAKRLQDAFGQMVVPEHYEATLRALQRAPSDRALDVIGFDLYDPYTMHQIRNADALLRAIARGGTLSDIARNVGPNLRFAEPWEWVFEPTTMVRTLRALHDSDRPLPLEVMENGMCVMRPHGVSDVTRPDGVTRPEFLRAYVFATLYARAVERLPVRAYCHWTLVDNYELGRWAPRFGLYGLPDPVRGRAAVWAQRDAAGEDAAGAYGALARAAREGSVDVWNDVVRGGAERR